MKTASQSTTVSTLKALNAVKSASHRYGDLLGKAAGGPDFRASALAESLCDGEASNADLRHAVALLDQLRRVHMKALADDRFSNLPKLGEAVVAGIKQMLKEQNASDSERGGSKTGAAFDPVPSAAAALEAVNRIRPHVARDGTSVSARAEKIAAGLSDGRASPADLIRARVLLVELQVCDLADLTALGRSARLGETGRQLVDAIKRMIREQGVLTTVKEALALP